MENWRLSQATNTFKKLYNLGFRRRFKRIGTRGGKLLSGRVRQRKKNITWGPTGNKGPLDVQNTDANRTSINDKWGPAQTCRRRGGEPPRSL